MLITYRIVASIVVFTATFLALPGAGAPIDPTGALLASTLSILTLLMFAASARRWRAEVREHHVVSHWPTRKT